MTTRTLPPDQEALFQLLTRELEAAGDVACLRRTVNCMIGELLRRQNEVEFKLRAARLVGNYFDMLAQDNDALAKLRQFSVRAIRTLLQVRPQVAKARAAGQDGNQDSVAGGLRRRLSDLPGGEVTVQPTPILIVWPPPPTNHTGFEPLFAAAIRRRLRLITTFFQRSNSALRRDAPTPFLQSPVFAEALEDVVERFILPSMLRSRGVRMIQFRQQWIDLDEDAFWRLMEQDVSKEIILAAWETAWHVYRQELVFLRDTEALGWKTTYQSTPEFIAMEKALVRSDYFIPPLSNREIDLFASLLEPVYGRQALENAWTRLRQFYEQELDRRNYQEQARDGALRDTLLDCFNFFPDRIGELLALLCYFNFPRLSLGYLAAFTCTKGRTQDERERRIPYLMLFLADERLQRIRQEEDAVMSAATIPTESPQAGG